MTVAKYIDNMEHEHYIVFTMKDYAICILYDSRKTKYEPPRYIMDTLIENMYDAGTDLVELEV